MRAPARHTACTRCQLEHQCGRATGERLECNHTRLTNAVGYGLIRVQPLNISDLKLALIAEKAINYQNIWLARHHICRKHQGNTRTAREASVASNYLAVAGIGQRELQAIAGIAVKGGYLQRNLVRTGDDLQKLWIVETAGAIEKTWYLWGIEITEVVSCVIAQSIAADKLGLFANIGSREAATLSGSGGCGERKKTEGK